MPTAACAAILEIAKGHSAGGGIKTAARLVTALKKGCPACADGGPECLDLMNEAVSDAVDCKTVSQRIRHLLDEVNEANWALWNFGKMPHITVSPTRGGTDGAPNLSLVAIRPIA
jgi:hypothetical protein